MVVVLIVALFKSDLYRIVSKNTRQVYLSATLISSGDSSNLLKDIWQICVDELPGIIGQQLTQNQSGTGFQGFMFTYCKALPEPKKLNCSDEQSALDNLNGNRITLEKNINNLNKYLTNEQKKLDKLNNKTPKDEKAIENSEAKMAEISEKIALKQEVLDRVLADIPEAEYALETCKEALNN